MFHNKNYEKKIKKIVGLTGIRTHALGKASAPNKALQTLTFQGQTSSPIAATFRKLLGGTIADTMLKNYDPMFKMWARIALLYHALLP